MITSRVGKAISRYVHVHTGLIPIDRMGPGDTNVIAIHAQMGALLWQCYRRNFRGDFAIPCLVFVPNPELVKLILTEGESNG